MKVVIIEWSTFLASKPVKHTAAHHSQPLCEARITARCDVMRDHGEEGRGGADMHTQGTYGVLEMVDEHSMLNTEFS